MCVCERMYLCVCMHFIYSCTLLSGTQGPHLGGWDSLLRLHSLCQARWLLSLKEKEERWKGKGEGGSSESPLTAPEWPVPRATTSGDHLQLARHASSIPVPFSSRAHTFSLLFFQMGGGDSGGGGVFGQAVICALYFGNFSVSLLWVEEEWE